MLAANRVGKTEGVGLYEVTLHATGQYPKWWEGKTFNRPVKIWACGTTNAKVREILQEKLLGPPGQWGTGLIPKEDIIRTVSGGGPADSVGTIYVQHRNKMGEPDGTSIIEFKSYEMGRKAFEGTEQDVILEDEEPPLAIHTECLLRTMTTGGIILMTFTPLQGMSEVVLEFLPGGRLPQDYEPEEVPAGITKYVVMATWDDAPHLSAQDKEELWKEIPPFQRDARSKGIPQLGSGAIYPVPEDDYLVDDFELPEFWPRGYAMDVGWNRTAALWAAWDREADIVYLYNEHYRGQAEASINGDAIKARGNWMTGVIDPASRGRSQTDGQKLFDLYTNMGLKLQIANNAVESGIYEVWQRLSTGRLKVFKSLSHFKTEIRLYRRDDKGKVIKENDHLMDCMRYFILSGLEFVSFKPKNLAKEPKYIMLGAGSSTQWMA